MTAAPVATKPLLATPPSPARPLIAARGLTKRFGDLVVASDIEIEARAGEIHAVLGENGAGKSTLMKMLYGYYKPDSGHLEFDGEQVTLHGPSDARKLGVGMVFQNFTLIPALTVLENLALMDRQRGLRYDRAMLESRIRELSDRYKLAVQPGALVGNLSAGERQRAEIVKVLASDARILIFDEPTSVLAPHEVDGLLAVLSQLRADGYAVLVITHKMREVFACADRVTVLRRGRVVGGGPIAAFDEPALVGLMLGERAEGLEIGEIEPLSELAHGIRLQQVTVADGHRHVLQDIDLEVRCGEIVGIAAVAGNGQAALADVLLGITRLKSGRVEIAGADATAWSPSRRLAAGLSLIPEDPVGLGSVPAMSVRENLMLTAGRYPGKGRLLLKPALLRQTAETRAGHAPFAIPAQDRELGSLSGGNIQRVVITREITEHCRYLLAYYPSRGLDLASTRSVQRMLLRLRREGKAVLLISEDLDELQALADTVAVMHDGRIVGRFARGEMDLIRVGRMMTGAHE